ncbi:hypothetical protein Xbed_03735 [Xenorhabdus beddingii]|uniref:Uncharacterized protein n=1 Tax=Xenorhabdus beddingii TaxID=40578 RepID=A0A1Y2S630_9GAMM|nr:hypothetical protein Xbed_03735 [Xenorhabdus beddingii]
MRGQPHRQRVRIVGRLFSQRGGQRIQQYRGVSGGRHRVVQRISEDGLGEQHHRRGIVEHIGQPFGRVGGVERDISAAGLEDGE